MSVRISRPFKSGFMIAAVSLNGPPGVSGRSPRPRRRRACRWRSRAASRTSRRPASSAASTRLATTIIALARPASSNADAADLSGPSSAPEQRGLSNPRDVASMAFRLGECLLQTRGNVETHRYPLATRLLAHRGLDAPVTIIRLETVKRNVNRLGIYPSQCHSILTKCTEDFVTIAGCNGSRVDCNLRVKCRDCTASAFESCHDDVSSRRRRCCTDLDVASRQGGTSGCRHSCPGEPY